MNQYHNYTDHNCRLEDSVCVYLCLSSDVKIEDLVRITLYVTLIIENTFRVSLYRKIKGKHTCFIRQRQMKKFGYVLAEKS